MNISFDGFRKVNVPQVVLCYPNKKRICVLNAKEKKSEFIAVGVSSFEFSIYKYHEKIENEGFDAISIGKYIWLEDNGWYRIKNVSREDDGINPKLKVTSYDLSYELKQTYLTSFGSMGTEDDAQGGLDRYALYDASDKEHSIAHIFMDKNPTWKFKFIDPEISKNRRSFDSDSVTSYDFLTGDVSEAFECIFRFDSNDRSVSVFKVENLGKQVPIALSFRNLVKELNISWDENDIKTMLNVTGGNDASGTALSIASVNPSGNSSITNFSYFYDDMSKELKEKLEEYYQKMENSKGLISTALSQLKTLQDELNGLNNKVPSNEASTTWSEYGLVGLKAKANTYKEQMSVLTDRFSSDPVAQTQYNNYNTLWNAVNTEITVRQSQITTKENQIKAKQSEVQSYVVRIDEVLGEEVYHELQPYIREDNLCDSSYIVTSIMTESEILEMKQDLYNHGVEELNKVCYPQFDMEVDSLNFPVLFKYKEWTDQLELGDVLAIKYSDDEFIKARLLKMEINWEDFKDFKLTFSSKSSLTGGLFTFVDLFKMANRDNTTLKYKTSGWNQAAKKADEAYYNTNLKEFLDLSMQQIQSNAVDQEVVLDSTGITLSKKGATEKLWLSNRQLMLFDEPLGTNLKEPKIAIGMIEVNQNGVVTKAYGIGASLLLGKIVIAENLFIQNKNNTLTMGADGLKAKALNGFSVQINPDDPDVIFNISEAENKLFYIDANRKKLVFRGYAEIDEGKIGGWTITKNALYSGGVGMSSDATPGAIAQWAGNENKNIAPYRLTNQGELHSSKADISGKITAEEGRIGGWNITKNGLSGSSNSYIRGGILNIGNGLLAANDDEVNFGDYMVSADGTGTLRSSNGLVNITDQLVSSGPISDYAQLTIGNPEFPDMVVISGQGHIDANAFNCSGDVYFENDSYIGNWGTKRMLKQLYWRLDLIRDALSSAGLHIDGDKWGSSY